MHAQMSASSRRQERTIIVETGELGPVRVRRLSLGGMARIAERLRAEGMHDDAALGEALVAEVVVASLDQDDTGDARSPDPFDTARLALLSEDDRRSIAAAVLTLEGVKAAGDGVVEDPRTTLARRYSHVLDTKQSADLGDAALPAAHAMPGDDLAAGSAAGGNAVEAPATPQFALFEGLIAPPGATAAASPAAASDAARAGPATARSGAAWERERARLQADVADLEALLAQQAQQREALESSVATATGRERDALHWARRYRFAAGGLLAVLVVALGAQFAWIGMLRRDAAQEQARLTEALRAQRQELEQAQRAAAEAQARLQQLEARRSAPRPSAAKPVAKPSSRSSKAPPQSKAAAPGGTSQTARKP